MSADSKQFNRKALSYEDLDRRISRARQQRSAAFRGSAIRLAAAVRAGSRRLYGRVREVVHQEGESASGMRRRGWLPVVSAAGGCDGAARGK